MANFASDNTAPVHPKVMQALMDANHGNAAAYGNDKLTEELQHRFRATFNCPELRVFPVFNGSACNGLALARMARPYESILAHQQSHINNDECGLPEFFTGGKIVGLPGPHAKLSVDDLGDLVDLALGHAPHTSRPKVVSLTQSTELGTVYSLAELRSLAEFAKSRGLYLHMDGARIANAIATLGCSPEAMTTEIGIDILSFGGTKNGAMLAEAAVIFNPDLVQDFAYIHKRAGQLPSKARFISAQLLALLKDDLWLDLGRAANQKAQVLMTGLLQISGVRLLYPVEANEVFVELPQALAVKLFACGHQFYKWPNEGTDAYRLVTSFATSDEDIASFLADCQAD